MTTGNSQLMLENFAHAQDKTEGFSSPDMVCLGSGGKM